MTHERGGGHGSARVPFHHARRDAWAIQAVGTSSASTVAGIGAATVAAAASTCRIGGQGAVSITTPNRIGERDYPIVDRHGAASPPSGSSEQQIARSQVFRPRIVDQAVHERSGKRDAPVVLVLRVMLDVEPRAIRSGTSADLGHGDDSGGRVEIAQAQLGEFAPTHAAAVRRRERPARRAGGSGGLLRTVDVLHALDRTPGMVLMLAKTTERIYVEARVREPSTGSPAA